jgi:hypothetical protein
MKLHLEIWKTKASADARVSVLINSAVPNARVMTLSELTIKDRRTEPDVLTQALTIVSGSLHVVQYHE